jgi:hypothetical protein
VTSSQCQIGRKICASVRGIIDIEFAVFDVNTRTPAEYIESPDINSNEIFQTVATPFEKKTLFLSEISAFVTRGILDNLP